MPNVMSVWYHCCVQHIIYSITIIIISGKIFKAEVKKEKEEADEDNIKPTSKKVNIRFII